MRTSLDRTPVTGSLREGILRVSWNFSTRLSVDSEEEELVGYFAGSAAALQQIFRGGLEMELETELKQDKFRNVRFGWDGWWNGNETRYCLKKREGAREGRHFWAVEAVEGESPNSYHHIWARCRPSQPERGPTSPDLARPPPSRPAWAMG